MTAISAYNNTFEVTSSLVTASGFITGRPFATLVDAQTANYIAISARF